MKKMDPNEMKQEHRTAEHIEKCLKHLGKLWEHHPEKRLGQLLLEIAKEKHRDIFQISDDEWIECIDSALEKEKLLRAAKK